MNRGRDRRRAALTRVRLAVAAAAALTLAAPPAAAGADPAPWVGVDCATGTLTVHATPDHTIVASGWIQPCTPLPPGPDARFTIEYYGPGSARHGQLIAYAAGGPTQFARSLDTAALDEPVLAACLIAQPGPSGRVACALVGPPPGSGLPQPVPIGVYDPVVTRPLPGANPVQDHFCGTCV